MMACACVGRAVSGWPMCIVLSLLRVIDIVWKRMGRGHFGQNDFTDFVLFVRLAKVHPVNNGMRLTFIFFRCGHFAIILCMAHL